MKNDSTISCMMSATRHSLQYPSENRRQTRIYLPIWKRLFAGTLPLNDNLFAGTLPLNDNLFAGTLPLNDNLFAGTLTYQSDEQGIYIIHNL